MLKLDNFETSISPEIVQRGQSYFKKQAIESLEEEPPGTWLATVEGTDTYAVEVVLSGKKIIQYACDCPYHDGPVCKHVVAVLFALREQLSKPLKKETKKTGKLTFEDLLLKTDIEELRNFIHQYKRENRDFGQKFMLFFADKDPNMDVQGKYETLVRQIIRSNSSRGYMDYRQTYAFSKAIGPVENAAETALKQKNYRDAFTIGKVLCNELLPLIPECDDSAGNISGAISSGIRILDNIADAPTVSPELLEQMLVYFETAMVNKTWFEYGDFGDELLEVVEKAALKTEPVRFLRMLDMLEKIQFGSYGQYHLEQFKKERVWFYERIGLQAEADKLIAANLEIIAFRQAGVEKAIAIKDFTRAKQLVEGGIQIAEGKKHPGTVKQWEEILLKIARAQNDVATERRFTKKFAFDRDLQVEYYKAWKATYSKDEWPAVIEQHIQSVITEENARLQTNSWERLEYVLFQRLAPVYIQEAQWERLLQIVPKEASEDHLAKVQPFLSKHYPAELLAFYLKIIEKKGTRATSRNEYEHIAALMKKVKTDIKASKAAINGLATNMIQTYKHRPAMVEELTKVIKG